MICKDKQQLLKHFVSFDDSISQFLLTHWGRDKMAAIYQTTYSNAIS